MPTLTTSVNPLGSGTIVETGSGDNHIITANANSGYTFQNWLVKGYTQLEYIESTATQYIDTGIQGVATTKFEIDGLYVQSNSDENHGISISGGRYHMGIYQSKFHFGLGNSWINTINWDTSRHIFGIDVLNSKAYVDSNEYSLSGTPPALNVYLFAANRNSSIGLKTYFRMYGAKLYNGSFLLRNFIPVIRHSDGQVGMLDLVHFKFYGNDGTGVFIGGPVKEVV